ncbi:hypothetical protein RYX36_019987, partial [Vicia faba]
LPTSTVFHRNPATLPIAEENPTKGYTVGGDSNVTNSLRYQALGLDPNVLTGARYGAKACTAKSPMLLGVNALMARNFERSVAADTLGLAGQRRFMSDIPISSDTTNIVGLKPPRRYNDAKAPSLCLRLTHPPPSDLQPPISLPTPTVFHRNSATLPIAEENPTKGYTVGGDSNVINSLRYQALGLDPNVLTGARYGAKACTAKSPMLLGVNALMARNFERSMDADTLGLAGQRRFMSDIP